MGIFVKGGFRRGDFLRREIKIAKTFPRKKGTSLPLIPKKVACVIPHGELVYYNKMDPSQTRAIALAAKLAITGILPIILNRRTNPQKVGICIDPMYGFSWSREVLTAVCSEVLNDITRCIKGEAVSKRKIEAIRKLFKGAFYDRSSIFPPMW